MDTSKEYIKMCDCPECKGKGGEPIYSLTPFRDGNWGICKTCDGLKTQQSQPVTVEE